MGYGGPQAGYICVTGRATSGSCRDAWSASRSTPTASPAYRLALQAREQHIRREKATSNICTAQVLLAVMAAMYAAYHGPDGLASIARRVHRKAAAWPLAMKDLGFGTRSPEFFDTVSLSMPGQAAEAAARAAAARLQRLPGWSRRRPGRLRRDHDRRAARRRSRRALAGQPVSLPAEAAEALPAGLVRTTTFLAHPVFSQLPERDRDAAVPAAAGRP